MDRLDGWNWAGDVWADCRLSASVLARHPGRGNAPGRRTSWLILLPKGSETMGTVPKSEPKITHA